MNLNTVGSLTHNGRFARSQLVDTATNDFDGLIDGFRFHLRQSLFRISDRQQIAVFRYLQIAFVQLAQQFFRPRNLFVFDDFHVQSAVGDGQAGIADAFFTQTAARRIKDAVQLICDDLIQIDLQQQLRAALQIQTERHRTPPFG